VGASVESHSSAVTYLANSPLRTLRNKGLIEQDWIDGEGLLFQWAPGKYVEGGASRIAVYRLKRP
jgi:hypothetical protein